MDYSTICGSFVYQRKTDYNYYGRLMPPMLVGLLALKRLWFTYIGMFIGPRCRNK